MFRLFLTAVTLSVLGGVAAVAAPPPWLQQLSHSQAGPHPRLRPMALDYTLSWRGIVNAGQLRLEFDPPHARKRRTIVARSTAASTGPAAALFPYSHALWSEVDATSLYARFFHGADRDQNEESITINRYQARGVTGSEEKKPLANKRGVRPSLQTHHYAFRAHDVFSAMLFLRSQPLRNGEELTIVAVPFRAPNLITVKVIGRETLRGHNAIRLQVSMRRINPDTLELEPYRKLRRPFTLWLSDDVDRIPLELRASVFIGDVRATLRQRQEL